MILLIILFTPLLSSSNTWLQKQCIRKYIMIIIISANKFFINGIRSLVNMTMSAQRRYSQTLFLDNISDVNDKSLTIARTIIVDYSHPDIQQLAALLYRKKIIHGDIVFVVKSEILADPVENIIINSISTIVLDYIDVTQRLQKYLQNASDHRCIKVFRKSISSLDSCVNIKLTKQEDSLLPYIISGLNNKKIAQATDLSNMMISHYRRNIYQKLNVRNIAGLYHFLHSWRGDKFALWLSQQQS